MGFFDTSSAATPPDTIIAVGPGVIVEAVNTSIEILDKSGSVLMPPEDFSRFFSSIFGPGDSFSDPCLAYDDVAQRFYFGALELRSTPSFGQFDLFDFAASTSPNPTQASDWTVFRAVTSIHDKGSKLADFPQMGWNSDAVFVSVNRFDANAGTLVDNVVMAIDKSSILNPAVGVNPPLTTYLESVKTTSEQQQLIPAQMHGGSANLEYLVQSSGDGTTVKVWSETNYLSGNPTLTATSIKVAPYQDSPGVPELTYNVDDAMISVQWLDNRLVAAHDVGLSDGLNHVRWYEFDTSAAAPALVQQGDLRPGAGISTSYPSITVNAVGDLAMTYVQSASDSEGNVVQTPSMYITGWTAGDSLNAMEPGVLVQAGVAGAYPGFRGGDYSATELDPVDQTFWSAQEYTADAISTDDWGTAIAHYTLGPGPLLNSMGPTTIQEGSAEATLTITGSNFGSGSTVLWNGTPLATTWMSAQKVAATVPGRLLVEDGQFAVAVQDPSRPADFATSNSLSFTVTEAPLKAGPRVFLSKVMAGTSLDGNLATFVDPNPNEPITDYAATIDWGDQSNPSTGTISSLGGGKYKIVASHAYSVAGRYTITFTVTDDGTNPLTITDQVRVVGSVLSGTSEQITTLAHKSFSAVVAVFSDSEPIYGAGAYTAVITWGDGTHSIGRIKRLSHGQFSVTGTHRYATAGAEKIVVTIQRGKLARTVVQSTADVS